MALGSVLDDMPEHLQAKHDSFSDAVVDLVAALRERGMPSATNLLATVFGDAAPERNTAVPVQSLIKLVSGIGVNDRLVRTSLTRLVRDGILRNEKVGRESSYSIDPASVSLFDHADSRIYRHHELDWDGRWTLAVVDATASTVAERAALRRELAWLGMGTLVPNVLASPSLDPAAITSMLERVGGDHQVLITRGAAASGVSTMSDEEIARRCAPISELSDRYGDIIDWFTPVADAFDATSAPSPSDCWTTRLLLIATFRRVALSDPALPNRLLPESWNGAAARHLAASLYERVLEPSAAWFDDAIDASSAASSPGEHHRDRFS